MAKENEIVLFETEDAKVRLTVPIQEDTVWLTQAQMTELFDTSKQNVSLHINNCFKEGELDKDSVVKDFLTTASDGKNYKTKYYNLDVIISVGYRVKSQRGIEFRRWANKVLKTIVPDEKNIKRVLEILTYREVQKIAKDTIEYIIDEIKPGMPLKEIRFLCEEKMRELGADSFWYYDIGAFVFAGDETTVSVSGREYITSERYIATDDIITIDLSPQVEGTWGDYARTVIVQNGKAVRSYDTIMNAEWRRGVEMEKL